MPKISTGLGNQGRGGLGLAVFEISEECSAGYELVSYNPFIHCKKLKPTEI